MGLVEGSEERTRVKYKLHMGNAIRPENLKKKENSIGKLAIYIIFSVVESQIKIVEHPKNIVQKFRFKSVIKL